MICVSLELSPFGGKQVSIQMKAQVKREQGWMSGGKESQVLMEICTWVFPILADFIGRNTAHLIKYQILLAQKIQKADPITMQHAPTPCQKHRAYVQTLVEDLLEWIFYYILTAF
jgi:uncharacterized membrane protein (DUF106 family)